MHEWNPELKPVSEEGFDFICFPRGRRMRNADWNSGRLRRIIQGRVFLDEQSLGDFSRDRSIYEIKPLAVVLPEDDGDLRNLVEFARREGLALTARGGGSGTAGSALGRGLVVALPENGFWTRIGGFSENGRTARVSAGAGVYHNDLQNFLKQRGFFLPADVTSAAISRIGGNIATRASGPHALRYGSIDRFLESVAFITADGDLVNTSEEKSIPPRLKSALAGLQERIRLDEAARRCLESRKGFKTASGYNLSAFMGGQSIGRLIAQLMAGSVGTLGFIVSAVFQSEVYEPERSIVVLWFAALADAGGAVNALRQLPVAAIELISRETLGIIRHRDDRAGSMPDGFLMDSHLLFVEVTGSGRTETVDRIFALSRKKGFGLSAPPLAIQSDDEIEKLWNLRKRILWLIENPGPGLHAPAVVNDVGVPPERLVPFMQEVRNVFRRHGLTASVYGHAGDGNLHLRPLFRTDAPDMAESIRRVADEVYEAVFRHQGTVTAEHGMGRLRAPYLKREWGEAVHGYMREVKNIFDPGDLFNPGVMFSEAPITNDMRRDLFGNRHGRVVQP